MTLKSGAKPFNTVLYLTFILIFSHLVSCDNGVIDSFEILESLSQLALMKHHPQSIYSSQDNMTESLTSLLEDLKSLNLTEARPSINCSSLVHHSDLSRSLCNNTDFKCMSASDMLKLVPQSTKSVSEALARLCPLLLLQLHSNTCLNVETAPSVSLRPSSAAVWGYGLLFVTIISCCSLVGVLILPLLSKHVYHIVLMLFEGLAVGSLVGSSLFHLIPQTFRLVGQDKTHNYLWRSLLIFCGIYLFYLSERFMKIIMDIKKKRKNKKFISDDGENATELLKVSDKGLPVNGFAPLNGDKLVVKNQVPCNEKINNQNSYIHLNGDAKKSSIYPANNEIAHTPHHHEHTVHFEKGKSAIGTVAWMIIFGDGLHNFIDGLSIGAAFSESILAGVSISVAVICEEFPHELGDFAVLLSAGMTMKQALLYNFLSAITCYLGLVFGILLGDLAEGAPYIFALAAGMFLYIALVDMLGELGEALEDARKKGMAQQIKIFFIQNVGIVLGVAILFVMARYAEHFNFESLSAFSSGNDEILDDHVKSMYGGFQEAKILSSPLT